jgi:hypothetical protein
VEERISKEELTFYKFFKPERREENKVLDVGSEKRREKVVRLRELQRAIIYMEWSI